MQLGNSDQALSDIEEECRQEEILWGLHGGTVEDAAHLADLERRARTLREERRLAQELRPQRKERKEA